MVRVAILVNGSWINIIVKRSVLMRIGLASGMGSMATCGNFCLQSPQSLFMSVLGEVVSFVSLFLHFLPFAHSPLNSEGGDTNRGSVLKPSFILELAGFLRAHMSLFDELVALFSLFDGLVYTVSRMYGCNASKAGSEEFLTTQLFLGTLVF